MEKRDPLKEVANTSNNDSQESIDDAPKQPDPIPATSSHDSDNKENGFSHKTQKTVADNSDVVGCGSSSKPKETKPRRSILKTFDPLYKDSPEKLSPTSTTKPQQTVRHQLIIEDSDLDDTEVVPSSHEVSDDENTYVDASATQDEPSSGTVVPEDKNLDLEESLLKFYTPEKVYHAPTGSDIELASTSRAAESQPLENIETSSTSPSDQSNVEKVTYVYPPNITESDIVSAISRKLSSDCDIIPTRSKFTITESELENYNILRERFSIENRDQIFRSRHESAADPIQINSLTSVSEIRNISPDRSNVGLNDDTDEPLASTSGGHRRQLESVENAEKEESSDDSQESKVTIIEKDSVTEFDSIRVRFQDEILIAPGFSGRLPSSELRGTVSLDSLADENATDDRNSSEEEESNERTNLYVEEIIKSCQIALDLLPQLFGETKSESSDKEAEGEVLPEETSESRSKEELLDRESEQEFESNKEEEKQDFSGAGVEGQSEEDIQDKSQSELEPKGPDSEPESKTADSELEKSPQSTQEKQGLLPKEENSPEELQVVTDVHRKSENIEIGQQELPEEDRSKQIQEELQNVESEQTVESNLEQPLEKSEEFKPQSEVFSEPDYKESEQQELVESNLEQPLEKSEEIKPQSEVFSEPDYKESEQQELPEDKSKETGEKSEDKESEQQDLSEDKSKETGGKPEERESGQSEEGTSGETGGKSENLAADSPVELNLEQKFEKSEESPLQSEFHPEPENKEIGQQELSQEHTRKETPEEPTPKETPEEHTPKETLKESETPVDSIQEQKLEATSSEEKSPKSKLGVTSGITAESTSATFTAESATEEATSEAKTEETEERTGETEKSSDENTTESDSAAFVQPEENQQLKSGVDTTEDSYAKSPKSAEKDSEDSEKGETREILVEKEESDLPDEKSSPKEYEPSVKTREQKVDEECKTITESSVQDDEQSKLLDAPAERKVEKEPNLIKDPVEPEVEKKPTIILPEEINKEKSDLKVTDIDTFKAKMADLSEKLSEQQQENSDLKLQLNAIQQAKASLELEIRQKEEVIIKTQAEAMKNEQTYKQEIKSLREKLKENSKLIEKDGSKELEDQLREAKVKEAKAVAELNQRTKDDLNYQKIMEEYETTIATRFADFQKLKEEHETATRHLANIELAFSDVHQKYERTKTLLEGFKNNEEALNATLQVCENTCKQHEEKYESLKAHAKGQIEKSNKEILILKDKYETDVNKCKTIIKRLEIKCSSLEVSLQQKTEECDALSALCDEVTGKKV